MFDANGRLEMDGDHLDVSFRNTDRWPDLLPGSGLKSQAFTVGDPVSGPSVLMGAVVPGEMELDWEHTIDPMHFHGTDQYRMLLGGEWVLARELTQAGGFSFQESGRVYQEHPGPSGHAWTFLVYGDRRGERATLTLEADKRGAKEMFGDLVATDDDYPHPSGPKGVPAIATTSGECQRGYLFGSFADAPTWRTTGEQVQTLAGVWGDPTSGPVVYLINAGPDRVVVPACSFSTEALLILAGGSCRVGDVEYATGDIRVQQSGQSMGPVSSGREGMAAALLVADRRATVALDSPTDGAGEQWLGEMKGLLAEVRGADAVV